MNLDEIKSLIKIVSKYKIQKLKLKLENCNIYIKNNDFIDHETIINKYNTSILDKNNIQLNNNNNIIHDTTATNTNIKENNKNLKNNKYLIIKSPMIGTFYRKPSPNKEPYVNIGDIIKPGVKLCIIEAMKLFNDIESEVYGKIIKILAEDNSPVEYNQPLFLVNPL